MAEVIAQDGVLMAPLAADRELGGVGLDIYRTRLRLRTCDRHRRGHRKDLRPGNSAVELPPCRSPLLRSPGADDQHLPNAGGGDVQQAAFLSCQVWLRIRLVPLPVSVLAQEVDRVPFAAPLLDLKPAETAQNTGMRISV